MEFINFFLYNYIGFYKNTFVIILVGKCSRSRELNDIIEDLELTEIVKYLGFQDDIYYFYDRCFAVLNFVDSGRGENVKSLEALVNGKILISHNYGFLAMRNFYGYLGIDDHLMPIIQIDELYKGTINLIDLFAQIEFKQSNIEFVLNVFNEYNENQFKKLNSLL